MSNQTEIIIFDNEEEYINMFLDLPGKLYSKRTLMQNKGLEEDILRERHYINKYVRLKKIIAIKDNKPVARCVITMYPKDTKAYFGFFECIEDYGVFLRLMEEVEALAINEQYTCIEGPMDVAMWIGYRLKMNDFNVKPYSSEPYNLSYYKDYFLKSGYRIKEKYVSNRYSLLPKKDFELPVYKERTLEFEAKGYKIVSPKKSQWDKAIVEVYNMICALYNDFTGYMEISCDEFVSTYNGLKDIADFKMIKLAYYHNEPVGFFIGIPNYGNLHSKENSIGKILEFIKCRYFTNEYVHLYMGVLPEHKGIGKVLTHHIMMELSKKNTPSIGSLIRVGNKNYDYAKEYMTGRFEYAYLEKELSIHDILRRGEKVFLNHNYIYEKYENHWIGYTYEDFVVSVKKCSGFMINQNWKGKKIGIYGKNSYSWMISDISIMTYVGVCFPIDSQYGQPELRNILSISDIDVLLYDVDKSDIIKSIEDDFKNVTFMDFDKLKSDYNGIGELPILSPVSPYDTVKIIYTSGTSANPKAIMLTQRNMLSNWHTLFKRTPMVKSDIMYLVLPLHHVYANIAAFLYSLISGMSIYLGRFHTETFMKEFSEIKPTVFIGVPLIAEYMWKCPDRDFGGRLKYFYCGGTKIRQELKDSYIKMGIPFVEAYGLSETSSVVALDVIGEYKEGSVGVIMDNLEAGIDNPDENGVGELMIKGKSVMSGYYRDDITNKTLFNSEGFLHTGDLAKIDKNRNLYIMGRKRRLILTDNGKNIFPDEVEERLCKNADITRALFYQEDNILKLKIWYIGCYEDISRFVSEVGDSLPKYMKYKEVKYIPDTLGVRMK